jgi:transcriptional regulator with XRE-family HTH domain
LQYNRKSQATKDLQTELRPETLADVVALTWHVGDVVRKLRQGKSWTQKQLAKAAKVHHNTVVRLEDGDEGVQSRTLKVIAEALGATLRDLYSAVPQTDTGDAGRGRAPGDTHAAIEDVVRAVKEREKEIAARKPDASAAAPPAAAKRRRAK